MRIGLRRRYTICLRWVSEIIRNSAQSLVWKYLNNACLPQSPQRTQSVKVNIYLASALSVISAVSKYPYYFMLMGVSEGRESFFLKDGFSLFKTIEAVQQPKNSRKRRVSRGLNPKRSVIFTVKINCGIASELDKRFQTVLLYSRES